MEVITMESGHIFLLVDTSIQDGPIWNANRHPELKPTDLFYASLFMEIGGILALLFTLYPVVIILADPMMNQTFCYFLISSCVANSSVVLIMMLFCAPAVFYKIIKEKNWNESLFSSGVSSAMGGLFMYVYYVSLFSHFLMSFNRFFAIIFPLKYSFYFSKKMCFKLIAGAWLILTPILIVVGFQLGGCIYIYREEYTIFSYGLTTCSDILQKFELVLSTGIVIVTNAFDLIVAIGLMRVALRNKSNKTVEVELSFFIQTVLTGLVYFGSTALYHLAGHTFRSEDMWRVFFFDQFPKLLAILLIGIFTVTLQKRIREKFKRHFQQVCCLILNDEDVRQFDVIMSKTEGSSFASSTVETLNTETNQSSTGMLFTRRRNR